jgi:hypothetical protein
VDVVIGFFGLVMLVAVFEAVRYLKQTRDAVRQLVALSKGQRADVPLRISPRQ